MDLGGRLYPVSDLTSGEKKSTGTMRRVPMSIIVMPPLLDSASALDCSMTLGGAGTVSKL